MARTNDKTLILTLVLCLVASLGLSIEAAAQSKKTIFKLEDPFGDDYGDGRLVYPLISDFEKGDLDLLSLTARRVSGGTRFEAFFAKEIKQPGRESVDDLGTQLDSIARYGFYTFNIDIYIDKDREPGSGFNRLLPGREAEVTPEFAWERIVCLTPLPNEASARLRRLVVKSMRSTMTEESEGRIDEEALEEFKDSVPADIEEKAFFPTRVKVRNRTIEFTVPDSFLGGTADPNWGYLVVITAADIIQSIDMSKAANMGRKSAERFMALPVSPGTWQNRLGGGREGEAIQPPIMDMIVPRGASQEVLLDDYSTKQNRPARLPGVVPAQESSGS
ncbi:MAG: glucodextranase DOMON-like domain-containing protein [Thermoanaerobaculia bacterium]|jgi:hypothetical protein